MSAVIFGVLMRKFKKGTVFGCSSAVLMLWQLNVEKLADSELTIVSQVVGLGFIAVVQH